jgi:hypothetical protein
MTIKELSNEYRQALSYLLAHRLPPPNYLCRRSPLIFLSGNQRRLETHTKFPAVFGCGLLSSCLMDESQKGHANVASPGRLLQGNGNGTPTSLTRHTRIHQPVTTFPNYSQPNQEPPPCRFPRTKLNQVDGHLQRLHFAQVASIRHRICPLAMWDHSLWICQFCNDALHWGINTQVKRYKLQELGRGKQDSDPDMQNSNHYYLHLFHQQYSDSPATGKKLRYDSQQCWTALSKFFLDEAESRLPSTNNALLPRYLMS